MSTYMLTSSSLLYCNDIPCSFAVVSDHTGTVLNDDDDELEFNDASTLLGH